MLLAKRHSEDAGAAAQLADASQTPGRSRFAKVRSSIACSCLVWCFSNSLHMRPVTPPSPSVATSRGFAASVARVASSVLTCSEVTRMPEILSRRCFSSSSSDESSDDMLDEGDDGDSLRRERPRQSVRALSWRGWKWQDGSRNSQRRDRQSFSQSVSQSVHFQSVSQSVTTTLQQGARGPHTM